MNNKELTELNNKLKSITNRCSPELLEKSWDLFIIKKDISFKYFIEILFQGMLQSPQFNDFAEEWESGPPSVYKFIHFNFGYGKFDVIFVETDKIYMDSGGPDGTKIGETTCYTYDKTNLKEGVRRVIEENELSLKKHFKNCIDENL